MRNRSVVPIGVFLIIVIFLGLSLIKPVNAYSSGQMPTGVIPTVTSTPRGPYVIVNCIDCQ